MTQFSIQNQFQPPTDMPGRAKKLSTFFYESISVADMFSQAVVNKGRDGGGKEGRKRHLSAVTTNNLLSVWVMNISDMIYVLPQHMCSSVICAFKGLIKLIRPNFRETYLFIILHILP